MKFKNTLISDISIGSRSREDFGDLELFASTISEQGLIHPITIDTNNTLIAGGRRLAACKLLKWEKIPTIIIKVGEEVSIPELELLENLARKNFTWPERCAIIKKIYEAKKAKDESWSVRKTATFIDISVGGVSDQISMAKAIEVIPELASYETFDEASKKWDAIQIQLLQAEQAKRVDALPKSEPELFLPLDEDIASPSPADKKPVYSLREQKQLSAMYQTGDTMKFLEALPDNHFGQFTFMDVDPDYGIGFKDFKNVQASLEHYHEILPENFTEFFTTLCHQLYRVMESGWITMWFGERWQTFIYDILIQAGFKVDPIPCIWVKPSGRTQVPKYYPQRCYESFFLASKNDADGWRQTLVEKGFSNVFNYTQQGTTFHPATKPIPLLLDIITKVRGWTNKDSQIFIPFAGSGNAIKAAYATGAKNITAMDLAPEFRNEYIHTLKELV